MYFVLKFPGVGGVRYPISFGLVVVFLHGYRLLVPPFRGFSVGAFHVWTVAVGKGYFVKSRGLFCGCVVFVLVMLPTMWDVPNIVFPVFFFSTLLMRCAVYRAELASSVVCFRLPCWFLLRCWWLWLFVFVWSRFTAVPHWM